MDHSFIFLFINLLRTIRNRNERIQRAECAPWCTLMPSLTWGWARFTRFIPRGTPSLYMCAPLFSLPFILSSTLYSFLFRLDAETQIHRSAYKEIEIAKKSFYLRRAYNKVYSLPLLLHCLSFSRFEISGRIYLYVQENESTNFTSHLSTLEECFNFVNKFYFHLKKAISRKVLDSTTKVELILFENFEVTFVFVRF